MVYIKGGESFSILHLDLWFGKVKLLPLRGRNTLLYYVTLYTNQTNWQGFKPHSPMGGNPITGSTHFV